MDTGRMLARRGGDFLPGAVITISPWTMSPDVSSSPGGVVTPSTRSPGHWWLLRARKLLVSRHHRQDSWTGLGWGMLGFVELVHDS